MTIYFMQFGEKIETIFYEMTISIECTEKYWKKNHPVNSIKTSNMLKEIERSDSVFY